MEWAATKNGETCKWALVHQTTQNGILTRSGLLKSGKSDEMLEARTGRLVSEQPVGLFTEHTDKFVIDDDDMDSNTVTESDFSLKSRSFLHRVNDQVRKRQLPIFKRCNKRQRQTFCDKGNDFVFGVRSICIHGKDILRKFTFHQKYREQSHFETDVWHIWKSW